MRAGGGGRAGPKEPNRSGQRGPRQRGAGGRRDDAVFLPSSRSAGLSGSPLPPAGRVSTQAALPVLHHAAGPDTVGHPGLWGAGHSNMHASPGTLRPAAAGTCALSPLSGSLSVLGVQLFLPFLFTSSTVHIPHSVTNHRHHQYHTSILFSSLSSSSSSLLPPLPQHLY
jgi:hypothetical protein